MYCIANICYVCLKKKNKSINNINSSLSVNKDIIHIIGYLPFNLAWLKTNQIILICEECCLRLRETYQFQVMCLRNSALLQNYKDKLKSTSISNTENEAILTVTLDLNNIQEDMNEVNREIKLENEEMYRDESGPIIEKTEVVCVNVDDSFVKEEDTWKWEVDTSKWEEVNVKQEHPMDNNFAVSINNESRSEISVNSNAHITNTDSVSSGFTSQPEYATNKKELDAKFENEEIYADQGGPIIEENEVVFVNVDDSFVKQEAESPMDNNFTENSDKETDSEISVDSNTYDTDTDSDSSGFTRKQHVRSTNKKELKAAAEKSYTCAVCSKSFIRKLDLERHTRVHTGEKPFKCSRCEKCFNKQYHLMRHMRVHTGDKPFKCSRCEKCFSQKHNLGSHMRIHTGEKPFKCSRCEKCFSRSSSLAIHMRIHTGDKPIECSECDKCFRQQSNLLSHMRTHTGT